MEEEPHMLDMAQLYNRLSTFGPQATGLQYSTVYGGLPPAQADELICYMRKRGASPEVMALVLDKHAFEVEERMKELHTEEPRLVFDINGESRDNPAWFAQSASARGTGRPVSAGRDITLRDARQIARRMKAVKDTQARQHYPDELIKEIDTLLLQAYRDWKADA